MDNIAAVLVGCDSVRKIRPWEGEKNSKVPSVRPNTTTSVSVFGFSSAPVLGRFLFPFFFAIPMFSSTDVDGPSNRSRLPQISVEMRPESTTCSATDFAVDVSYIRRRCLSAESDKKANRFASAEKADTGNAFREEPSSTTGWDNADVLVGWRFFLDFVELVAMSASLATMQSYQKYLFYD